MSDAAAAAAAPAPLYQQVKCKASASLQANNLTANVHHFAYIHKNEVHLIENKPNMFKADKVDRAMRASNGDKDPITWLELCSMTAGSVLVVVSSSGLINVYEQTGEKLMHSHKLQKSLVAISPKDAYLRGVAHDGKELLFLGAGSGDVLLFNITSSKLSFVKKVPTGGNAAVHAVAYDAATGTLAAIDEQGSLFVWSSPVGSTDTAKAWEVKGNGIPATSVAVGYDYVITADINGALRYYSVATKALEVEIAAHARSISALHVHPSKPAVLTGSEDTFVSVWTLPTSESPSVKNVFQENIGTSIVVGARFIADSIVCTVYDSRSLYRFAAPAL